MGREFFSCVLCLCGLISLALCADEDKEFKEKTLEYKKPEVAGFAYFAEPFDSKKDFHDQWTVSQAKKDGVEAAISKYDGLWVIDEAKDNSLKGDKGLILKEKAKHHAISSMLPAKFEFTDQPLIVQYEVKFQNALECGGAYMKLLSEDPKLDLDEFTDKSGYTIMFGPDKCGEDSKLHFIFRHKNPKTGEFEEKHAKKPTGDFSKVFDDGKTHLFTLIVKPDNTFEVQVDKKTVNSGSLLKDFQPAVNPPVEIDDPSDLKPEDWDEREKIVDPKAKKPEDWDEDAPMKIPDPKAKKPEGWYDDAPETIPDPNAVKPADWDNEEDGEWEPPQIPNPKCAEIGCGEWKAPMVANPQYKGKWSPPMIDNPAYKGKWTPKKIPNPNFFEDNDPFKMTPIAAVGFELWSMTDEILFDNIIISSEQSVVDKWTADTWDLKFTGEFSVADAGSGGLWNALNDATKERPWLWAVYVAVVFLPIILIFACCFPSKKDETAEKKKTDEPTPDDEVTEGTATKEEDAKEEGAAKEDEEENDEKKGEAKVEDTVKEQAVVGQVDSVKDEEPIVDEEDQDAVKKVEDDLPEIIEENQPNSETKAEYVDDVISENQNGAVDVDPEEEFEADGEVKEDPKAEPEEDIPPPDASPRTRASRRKARKDT